MSSTIYDRHDAYHAIEKMIEEQVKALSDDELHFAYWLNYESEGGQFEEAIRAEYNRRRIEKSLIG